MTQLLEKAIDELSKLAEDQQDSIASLILEEMEDDRRWSLTFDKSPEKLEQLAKEALDEYHIGKTKSIDPSDL